MKLDRDILENPEVLDKVKNNLRKVLGVKSDDKESKLEEANGNFRYKKVKIDGVDVPLDIDVSFMPKSEEVQYSTDMAIKDRLNGIKENDPEGYKRVIANIVLAKEMLKKEGIYKKRTSEGATMYGGFGGSGVENWILQNGGSFVKAMQTFLEAADRAKSFEEFEEIYPIFDFGQNHMSRGYSHDSFVRGISSSGYSKMQETFLKELQPERDVSKEQEEIKQEAEPQPQTVLQGNETQQRESTVSMSKLGKNAMNQKIRTSEFREAAKSMNQELQVENNQDLEEEQIIL